MKTIPAAKDPTGKLTRTAEALKVGKLPAPWRYVGDGDWEANVGPYVITIVSDADHRDASWEAKTDIPRSDLRHFEDWGVALTVQIAARDALRSVKKDMEKTAAEYKAAWAAAMPKGSVSL
jgi:hypothetical protein